MLDPSEKDSLGLALPARAVFFIDPEKKMRASVLYPATTGRNFDEILRMLDSMQLCDKYRVATPEGWKKGDDVMVQPNVTDEEKKNASWLAEKLFTDTHELFDVPEPCAPGPSKRKCFSDLSASQQERNTKDIRDNYCSEALTYAAISVLRKEQKPDLAKAVTIGVKSPEKVLSVPSQKLPQPFSPNEAIALFIINGKQTKAQYQNMRAATIWKGALSEEPQEARNKDFKKFRTDFSRKISRKANLQDVFNRLMLTSDPLFFHIYQTFQKSKLSKKTEKEHLPIDILNIEDCIDNDIMAQAYDSSSDEESEEIDSIADDVNDSDEFEDIFL
ncbi:unnamed protein product [Ceutorhynchus assimilis]|uniref:Peroxiredoxin C-terminal domain-containing protein n=1 Tax=Ceutorhynchus assimilis TaxID=467358 RepID=A0A9N9QMY8_9CUCU|nr:unnamed protein product [Ceutorhynchus assimilis]